MSAQRQPNPELGRFGPLLDAAAILLAGYGSWWLRWSRPEVASHYLLALLFGLCLALVLLPAARAYRTPLWWHPLRGVLAAAPGLVALFGALMLIATLTKTSADFSRLWMAGWVLLSLPLMSGWRFLLGHFGRASGRRVLLLGSGALARETAQQLSLSGGPAAVAGCVRLPGEAPSRSPVLHCLGTLAELEAILAAAEPAVTELWLAPDQPPGRDDDALLTRLRLYSLPVCYVPDLSMLNLLNQRASEVDGVTVIALNATPLDGPDAWLKSLMDISLALLLLLLLAPLLLLVALLVRLDSPGPVLYRQLRHGSGGQLIEVLKFRTMSDGAPSDSFSQARRDDSRVTRSGRFLRRSSLDELPQLLNVLRGDMSLVGPRPHPVALNEEYAAKLAAYMQRHRVKPGITGWAQINGYRGETDTLEKMQKRLQHDLYYIEHWSPGLDLQILAKTALLGWTGANAY
ncbi:undecaprenyl-phosphate glucose phosphotransferase [Haliea sp. E1-2-M8]|uniref:undecaprenyl-phosphate glucose phosphotransferase n=1 Tax=Haliea sp. E1-2-M8 TaxID=3064706 RepID=UPI002717A8C2|nr:undecaprenyl-phosphate glucose phosphotransferase [Haliea sp. E1-2-M8]MDO8862437.1 undecaprenyl-phosphate glucose phosphotransferase [Haliea sp. E1-2-M8]